MHNKDRVRRLDVTLDEMKHEMAISKGDSSYHWECEIVVDSEACAAEYSFVDETLISGRKGKLSRGKKKQKW